MKIKYIRVSTIEQNTIRQEKNSKGFDKVYIDKVSGSISFFVIKEALKLVDEINNGNIKEIHINSIDRLGRNILDILTVLDFFNKKSINLFIENIGMYSLIDNKENLAFKMITSVLGNVAEMERNLMLERQKQGIEIAKLNGIYQGRKKETTISNEDLLKKYSKVVKELKKGESLRRAAAIGKCSLGTAQKIKKILNQEEYDCIRNSDQFSNEGN